MKRSDHPLLYLARSLSLWLRLVWTFFPAIIFILLGYFAFWKVFQGRDIVIHALELSQENKFTVFFVLLAVSFWVYVTWYSSRIIAYNKAKPEYIDDKAITAHDTWNRRLTYTPRLLGFVCFAILQASLTGLPDVKKGKTEWLAWGLVVLNLVLVWLLSHFLNKWLEKWNNRQLRIASLVILAGCLAVALLGIFKTTAVVLAGYLSLLETGFLFLIISRRKILEYQHREYARKKEAAPPPQWKRSGQVGRCLDWLMEKAELPPEERVYLIAFNVVAMIAIIVYGFFVFNLNFAIAGSTLPLVLLAFGILLGLGNIITIFSINSKVNLHFLLFLLCIVMGKIWETHEARTIALGRNSVNRYAERPSFTEYFNTWYEARRSDIERAKTFPVYFVLADGGASRSGYFVAATLGALEDSTDGAFSNHLFCLSGASGGSVGNAAFYSLLKLKKEHAGNPMYDSVTYRRTTEQFLKTDFLTFTLARMLGPDVARSLFTFLPVQDRAAALEQNMEDGGDAGNVLHGSFRRNFSDFIYTPGNRSTLLPVLCINTTRVQDGRPSVVSTIDISRDSNVFNYRADVLDFVNRNEEIRLSTAVVLGARFPYVSPAGKLGKSYFVDGGYFDNSGAGVVQEMISGLQRYIARESVHDPLLRKLDFYVLHITNSPVMSAAIQPDHGVLPLVNDLAAPVQTLIGAYGSQTSVNDSRLINFLKDSANADSHYRSLDLYDKDQPSRFSMNWVISNINLEGMNTRLDRLKKGAVFKRIVEELK